ncbi:MAG TPA: hypothetical protein VGM06_07885 [Polyangiaceae bacterium]|jgi:hypothetical protein
MTKIQVACWGAALAVCAACTSGQGEVDVIADRVATFPGIPQAQALAGVVMTTDAVVSFDEHGDLASLGKVGTFHATIVKNSLSGSDLAFVTHVRATIAADDGAMPEVLLSDVDVPASATEVALPLALTDAQVVSYLSEGKVDIRLELTGTIPERPMTLTHSLVAHVSVDVAGSVTTL